MMLLALLKSYGFKYTTSLLLAKIAGLHSIVYISDNFGNKYYINVDRKNISHILSLLSYLHDLNSRYILQNGTLLILISNYRKSLSIDKLTINDLNNLYALTLAHKFKIELKVLDDKYLLSTSKYDSIQFIVRENALLPDITGGPLLFYDEPQAYKWFDSILKPDDVFVDVGAYIGGYSVRACKRKAKVYSVEPDKDNYLLLLKNLEVNHCTKYWVYRCAAYSEDGVIPLRSYGSPDTCSIIAMKNGNTIKDYVISRKLDNIIATDVEDIKLLKIDVEGAELSVLKGAKEVLKKSQYVMVEVWPHTRNRVLDLLKKSGFKLIDSEKCVPPTTNMLFIHK